jgi:hypothetical protein
MANDRPIAGPEGQAGVTDATTTRDAAAGAATLAPPPAEAPVIPSRLAPRATWRRLRMAGFSAEEAGNLVAHLAGLPIGRAAWTVREVENLLFIRAMAIEGRIRA